MEILEKLYKEHNFKHELYIQVRKNLKSNYIKDVKSISNFVDELPYNLRQQLTMEIYKPFYDKVIFLKDRTPKFLSWICPLLRTRIASTQEYIY